MQKNLKISIFGKSYFVASDEKEDELLFAAKMLDDIMKNSVGSSDESLQGKAIDEKIVVITALQVALELNKKNKLLEQYESKFEALSELVDNAV